MKQKNFESLLYSSLGIVAMFLLVLALYVVIAALKVGADVTQDRVHTLSPGTRKILDKLDSRVTIRFYCTQDGALMPPQLRNYGQQIEDLLAQYKEAAHGKLVIEKYDPEPDSDAEDAARLNGVTGQQISPFSGDKIYIGIVVSMLDDKFVLPWLPPDRERLLEYDISRAIARVVDRVPPVVGIMSALPVFGEAINPMSMTADDRGKDPWAFVMELKKDFTVKEIPMTATNIDSNIKVLIVMHPRGIKDPTQYALDQYVLRGGKMIAFLDPHAFFDQTQDQYHAFQVMGDASGQSTLNKLLPAWGLNMDMDRVIADMTFGSRNSKSGDMSPTIITVTRQGIDANDAATGQIDNLLIPFGGAFEGKPAPGLTETVLVKSSPNAQLVDALMSSTSMDRIMREFKAAGTNFPIAVHLTGKFKTAYPDRKAPGQLLESTGGGEVVLVADSDMLNDKACVRIRNDMGHRIVQPTSGNLNFLQSLVEEFSGDDDLIAARSRASMSRPFTRVKEMEAKAGKQWEDKIRVLETKQREMEKKISELQTHADGSSQQQIILSPEQENELQDYQKTRMGVARDLKQVRKRLRQDTDALAFWIKILNIGAVPVLVAVSGLTLAIIKRKRRAAK